MVACLENMIDVDKLLHEAVFGNCNCSFAVHLQSTPFPKPYVWYRGATYATVRLRIGSGMTKLLHIKYSVTTLLSCMYHLTMGLTVHQQLWMESEGVMLEGGYSVAVLQPLMLVIMDVQEFERHACAACLTGLLCMPVHGHVTLYCAQRSGSTNQPHYDRQTLANDDRILSSRLSCPGLQRAPEVPCIEACMAEAQ
jgi:hypothetical protein